MVGFIYFEEALDEFVDRLSYKKKVKILVDYTIFHLNEKLLFPKMRKT